MPSTTVSDWGSVLGYGALSSKLVLCNESAGWLQRNIGPVLISSHKSEEEHELHFAFSPKENSLECKKLEWTLG
jgi:hypothetical protein